MRMMLGGERGREISVGTSESRIAVRTVSRGPILKSALSKNARSMMGKAAQALQFDGAHIAFLQSDEFGAEEMKAQLKDEDQFEFAGSALKLEGTNETIAYTEKMFVALQPDASDAHAREMLSALGDNWHVARRLTVARHAYLLAPRKTVGKDIFDLSMEIVRRSEVDRCHPEFLRERGFRGVYPQQWHLGKRVIDGRLIEQSAEVDGAWTASRGKGVTIAVIDDGVDTGHPEFATPGKIVSEFDFTERVADARPKNAGDNHGTACAGVACAAGIAGAAGVAPDAALMPIRLRSGLGGIDESDAIMWAVEKGADVISCSWGPVDGKWFDPNDPRHNFEAPISDNTALALEAALHTGRQGRGCVVCWAAGNGNESVDLDGWASFPGVTAVAACDDRGVRSVYSDFGDAIDIAFPSNTFAFGGSPEPLTPGIWTTDRSGSNGYNQQSGPGGNFTESFGGTSSACPGAAGAAALVLAVDPMMRGDEVVQALQETAVKIDAAGGNYDANGHSDQYGAGRVNAEAAVYSRLQLV
ncbi:S8 family serine peptidase [Primorskyibacter aestuariivivens]|uniref:S8 family serine peptidase n=1 Tax=Primorskyibacter aestuariivivens TaxID=1888912 RepID=UPI002300E0D1|nr:S8 family serine peptidase [Primorskyibacter aestuariivivens]MDA7430028.1 S8 family serine peptidase [Primorskyibacter aestuariivivens]